jgi:GNAT superfamily N-acetyltransferase
MADLQALRLKARLLLNLSDPLDALYAYYALYHDPGRASLFIHEDAEGHTDGFAAVCQTGQRLFQPTVALRAKNERAALDVLRQALIPGRPYTVLTTLDLMDAVAEIVDVEQAEINHLYQLELIRFQPIINVLVVTEEGVGGLPRFVIRLQDKVSGGVAAGGVAAEAGLNWASPHFAEVFVYTVPEAQGRGWGRSVLAACTMWAVHSARQPLYVVNEANAPSIALAASVGYVDTGVREFAGEGVCKAKD